MTIFKHELRRGKLSLIIWTAALSFIIAVSILIYPAMADQMKDLNDMMTNMGGLSDALGMNQLNFEEFISYFGMECGDTLSLGGAFFAVLLGISALSKEEKDRTAEFLLTNPISRKRIVAEKLLAIAAEIFILNLIVSAITVICVLLIGQKPDFGLSFMILFACFFLQLELAAITFGISARLRKNGIGLGIGLAAGSYFLNLLSNLVKQTKFLKYITPFGYAESAGIIADKSLNIGYMLIGAAVAVIGILYAFWQYDRKDIT